MKLEGSLDAFSLPDIFQLLSYTKKTGGLRLQHADVQGVVYFADGLVTGAVSDTSRQSLARRVLGAGLVQEQALPAAVGSAVDAGHSASGGGVVAALVAADAVDSDAVTAVATEALHDAVFELLRWPAGDFAFAADQANPDDLGLRLASDAVVTRASEQQAQWTAATSVVPSPEAVPAVVGSREPKTIVTSADWGLLRLVDGRRRVSELVDLLGGGQFATVTALADLVERGLVEVRAADAADPIATTQRLIAALSAAESDPVADPVPDLPLEAESATEPGATVTPAVSGTDAVDSDPDIDPHIAGAAESVEDSSEGPAANDVDAGATEHVIDSPEGAPSTVPAPAEVTAAVVKALRSVEPAADADPSEAPATDTPVPPVVGSAQDEDATVSTVVTVVADASVPGPAAARPAGPSASAPRLGGAHVPGDVVPPRAEPFLASRKPDFAEPDGPSRPAAAALRSTATASPVRSAGAPVVGSAAVAMASGDSLIERDPSVNRSLLLRLIAGVRGL